MTDRTVSDLLVAGLEAEGVDHVFGLPGEETEDVLFSLRDSDVAFVPCRHEQGAAFMADVHGRLTGAAGVCLSTLGPGATNLLTGVADAHLDKSPVVAVTCQGGLERLHHESHQALDVLDLFEPVTKWNAQLNDPAIVHESVRKAFKLAELEKPGVTHLELPEGVAGEPTDDRPFAAPEPVPDPRPNADALAAAADLFRAADRPLVLAGNGAVRARAADELRRLVEVTDVPVVSTFMGKGAVSDEDPRSLMTLESGDGAAMDAVREADLVVALGYDVAEHDPGDWLPPDAPLVHADSEAAEVYHDYDPDVEVVADVARTVAELADVLADATTAGTDWYADYREAVRSAVAPDDDPEPPFAVAEVLPLLREAMAPADVLISDVGAHKMAIARHYPTYEPNTCVISNGLASMGIAVPGALAADLAVDANVVAATGDGGFLMNAAELETATRIGCGYTVVVFNNDEYGIVADHQREHRGESVGTDLTNPDLVRFAESFGIEGRRAESAAELRDALDLVDRDEMALVEVPVTRAAD
jgi:acetolactate synthase-1/2/3 large subunit